MRRLLILNPISRRIRHSQRGQSILLLAFAFIALIAFVGLVTDVALLFVRYASLRRAVDAAAIAAAGQIREGTDFGAVAIAASQYIELHNLDPNSIIVETCETDIHAWRTGTGKWDGTPHPESLLPAPVNKYMEETELCDWDNPHKLVRVSAQIESPTTFLGLLGIDEIRLEATSVSETAVRDIALVIDVSESMSIDTTVTDYAKAGLYPGGGAKAIPANCDGSLRLDDPKWGQCCNDPGTGYVGDGERQSNGIIVPNGFIWHDTNGNGMYDGTTAEQGVLSPKGAHATSPADPHHDTLVCNPFKDVKDAARLFIKRLDFVRGDRVVLVTFDRIVRVLTPPGANQRPLMRSEAAAILTLNSQVGVQENPIQYNDCITYRRDRTQMIEWNDWVLDGAIPPEPDIQPGSYESVAPCGNTNIGGGIPYANNALTDPVDVRREAVWVMIVLSDGAANVTERVASLVGTEQYGSEGYCPWYTFCDLTGDDPYTEPIAWTYHWSQCTSNNSSQTESPEPKKPICNDNDEHTRHFCLDWKTGKPDGSSVECSETGRYDADDYARDMADFAGLAEVQPGIPGNFIAMFAIAFGDDVIKEATGAPLLRYIADAGDNGFIDNNEQQDWRDNGVLDFGDYTRYGDPDVCEKYAANPTEQCGQYYYASDLATLNKVFEDIAGRLFTRLTR